MSDHAWTGKQLGRYQISRHLGRGGMADVYQAQDTDLQRPVALKIMLPGLSQDTQFVARFRREARTVAQLNHPNIVQIYDVGTAPDGQPYIAMQYIDGGSLRESLTELAERGKLLPTDQALGIVRQVADALGRAHAAGIVHRDLKPSNILISSDGTPVVVDLGIAAVEGGARLTATGSLLGTPHYMSPEQIQGRQVDGRSDLYSLGVMLYELLAGSRPFPSDSPIALMHAHVYEQPIPLASVRGDLTPQTLQVVDTLLQKEPAQRFDSAETLIAALDQAILAEGSSVSKARTTVVLTQVSDSNLISRGQVLRPAAQPTAADAPPPPSAHSSPVPSVVPPRPRTVPPPSTAGMPTNATGSADAAPKYLLMGAFGVITVLALVTGFLLWQLNRPAPSDAADDAPALVFDVTPTDDGRISAENPSDANTQLLDTDLPPTSEPSPTPTSEPTATLAPTIVPSPTVFTCPGASPTRLSVGGQARIINYQVNVRNRPTTDADPVNVLRPGREVDLIGGPACSDRQLWYLVRSEPIPNGDDFFVIEGWVVEESGDEWFMEPIQ